MCLFSYIKKGKQMTINLIPNNILLGVSDVRTIAITGPYQTLTLAGNNTLATATLDNDNASITLTGVKLGSFTLRATNESGDTATVAVKVATDAEVEANAGQPIIDDGPIEEYINDISQPDADENQVSPYQEVLSDTDTTIVEEDIETLQALYPLPDEGSFVYGRDTDRGIQGVLSSDLGNIFIEQVVLPITPAVSENVQNMAGTYGQHWLGNSYGARTISINLTSINHDEDEYRQTIENMSNALINLGQTEHSMTFGQYPDRTWFGHFTTMSDPAWINQGSWDFKTTLTFVASDPKAYLDTEQVEVVANPTIVTPSGNAESYPIISYVFKDDVKQFGYSSSQGGEVAVGFSDEQPVSDLRPRVYANGADDLNLFSQVTNIDDLKTWGPTGANIRNDAIFAVNEGGYGVVQKQYYDSSKMQYDKNTEGKHFGGLLTTGTFNTKKPSGGSAWRANIRGYHYKHYNRAIGKMEFYLLSNTGERLARIGIADHYEGRISDVYILFGKRYSEEQANLKKGIGYYGAGNTTLANDSQKNGKNKTVTIKGKYDQQIQQDRVVTTTETNTWYGGKIGGAAKIYYGDKTVNVTKKRITYSTPVDANGKKTGKQTSTTEKLQSTSNKSKVAISKVVKKKVGKKYVSVSQGLGLNSNRKVTTQTVVWNNNTKKTTTTNTKKYDREYYKKNGKWVGYWKQVGNDTTVAIDSKASGRASKSTITRNYNMTNYNNSDAFNSFFGRWHLEFYNNKLTLKLTKIDTSNGLDTGKVLLEKTFNTPKDMPLGQIAVYMGKMPIHEDVWGSNGKPIQWYAQTEQAVTDITVYKNLKPEDVNPARIIAHKGDTAMIDGETRNVYINGNLANELESAFSNYPNLKGGRGDEISVVPDRSKADVTITYRPSTR